MPPLRGMRQLIGSHWGWACSDAWRSSLPILKFYRKGSSAEGTGYNRLIKVYQVLPDDKSEIRQLELILEYIVNLEIVQRY